MSLERTVAMPVSEQTRCAWPRNSRRAGGELHRETPRQKLPTLSPAPV